MGRANNSFTEWVQGAHTIGGYGQTPEEHLFTAVLSQAVHDAFSTHVTSLDQQAARSFFLGKSKQFRIICEGAGRDPQYVHEMIRKKILRDKGWNVDEAAHFLTRKAYRQSKRGKKRGPKKKHLTGNAYYAAKAQKHFYYSGIGSKGGRPRIYNEIKR